MSLFNFYKNLVKGDHRNYYNTIYAQMMKYLHRVKYQFDFNNSFTILHDTISYANMAYMKALQNSFPLTNTGLPTQAETSETTGPSEL